MPDPVIPSDRTTIYARASGQGRAGVSLFRLSGPSALAAVKQLTRQAEPPARQATLTRFYDPESGELIDRGLLILFPGPASFTGEDLAELQLHGSPATERALFRALDKLDGLRPAEAGEFTERAFLHGKLDLIEVEGLADLIDAETEAERRLALRQMSGSVSQAFESWRTKIVDAMALAESSIDFVDEHDISEQALDLAREKACNLQSELAEILKNEPLADRFRSGLSIALSGAPNAGKSSLLNALLGEDKAIVTPVAGTTRDLIAGQIELAGLKVTLVDGAGLRESSDPVEQEGIRRARDLLGKADLVLWLVDSAAPKFPDKSVLAARPTWLILNKQDLAPSPALPESAAELRRFSLSAKEETGLDALLEALTERAKAETGAAEDSLMIQSRHRHLVREASEHLQAATAREEAELMAEHLRLAASAIGRITGKIDVEEVLGAIFSRFCIGK